TNASKNGGKPRACVPAPATKAYPLTTRPTTPNVKRPSTCSAACLNKGGCERDSSNKVTMAQIRISGWQPDCKTIPAIKLIRAQAFIRLDEALHVVNRVLNGEIVFLDLPSVGNAGDLAAALTKLGLIVDVLGLDLP